MRESALSCRLSRVPFDAPSDGIETYVPLRVISNGSGAEVQLTLRRVPGMTDEKFAADAQWVASDLNRLKALLEQDPQTAATEPIVRYRPNAAAARSRTMPICSFIGCDSPNSIRACWAVTRS